MAYGSLLLRLRLVRVPSFAEDYHVFVVLGEEIIGMLFTTPEVVEPTTLLVAGSVKAAEELGLAGADMLRGRVIEEYLQRCDHAGLPRRGRLKLPADLLAGVAGEEAE